MSQVPGMNLILIGMPGAGKSTIGPVLSQRLEKEFADLDDIIKVREKKELKDIVLEQGYEYFLKIQEQIILTLNLKDHVLATGGSVVKSPLSMDNLKKNGIVIYLKLDFETFEKRLEPGRRLARSGGQGIREVYDERTPLYSKYADITIECVGKSVEDIANEIVSKIVCQK